METEKKGCKKCNKGLGMGQKTSIIIATYILFAAIYGTIKLIKELSSLL
jgi:hypothetical protein